MFRIKTRFAFVPLAALLGCGGGGYGSTGPGSPPPPPPPPPANTVDATPAELFTPGNLSVAVGQVVTFKFGSLAHNVFFAAQAGAPADIPGTNANTSVTRQFNTQGTFNYTCHIHPNMHGTVTVQ
jgi:hypothetical protein